MIQLVKEFHDTFKLPVSTTPVQLSPEQIELRMQLILEEAGELGEALEESDINHQAKELCDLLYVVFGTALEMGIWDQLPGLMQEVHRSNMSKVWPRDLVIKEANDFKIRPARNFFYAVDGGFVVKNENGKVLKPTTYSPAKIEVV